MESVWNLSRFQLCSTSYSIMKALAFLQHVWRYYKCSINSSASAYEFKMHRVYLHVLFSTLWPQGFPLCASRRPGLLSGPSSLPWTPLSSTTCWPSTTPVNPVPTGGARQRATPRTPPGRVSDGVNSQMETENTVLKLDDFQLFLSTNWLSAKWLSGELRIKTVVGGSLRLYRQTTEYIITWWR